MLLVVQKLLPKIITLTATAHGNAQIEYLTKKRFPVTNLKKGFTRLLNKSS